MQQQIWFSCSTEIDMIMREENKNKNETLPTSLVPGRTGGGPRVLPRSEREDAGASGWDVDINVVISLTGGGQQPPLHHSLPLPVVQAMVIQSGLRENQLEVARVWVAEHSVTE